MDFFLHSCRMWEIKVRFLMFFSPLSLSSCLSMDLTFPMARSMMELRCGRRGEEEEDLELLFLS